MGEGVRGEAHGVVAGQLDHALLGADGAADDVAARVIGQSAEQAIEVGRGDLHGYNHMVVLLPCQGPDEQVERQSRQLARSPRGGLFNLKPKVDYPPAPC